MFPLFRLSSRSALTFLVILATTFSWIEKASAVPSISLSLNAGPPTTALKVSGSGFAANKAVDIYFDVTNLALVVTDASGSFASAAITVPKSALPGTQWITAVESDNGAAAQSPFLVRTNWVEYLFDASHSGFNPYENVIGTNNVGNLRLKWSAPIPAYSDSMVVADGIGYLSTSKMYAINLATGATLWSYVTGGNIGSAPAVANGVVYAGSYNGTFYAWNARTGKLLWSYPTGTPFYSSPAVVSGVVYVGSYDSNIYAFNAGTGAVLWSYKAGTSGIAASPAVAHGMVYVAGAGGTLYVVEAKTGVARWQYTSGGNGINGAPTVSNGLVFFGTDTGLFYALDASDGSFLWSYQTNQIVYSSTAAANGMVYLPSWDGNMYALDDATGTVVWSYPTAPDDAAPAVANGVVYIGTASFTGGFYALDAATGSLLWSYKTSGAVSTGPAVVNGMVYLASDRVYAFALPAGSTKTSHTDIPPDPRTLRASRSFTVLRPEN
jgi:outer membrane protein assembly factor BamB